MSDTGYLANEGLTVYESAMARPYAAYVQIALRKLIAAYQIDAGVSLDLACGGGHLVQFLATLGWHAHGCDLSADMIATAEANYPDLRDRLFVADMCALPEGRVFDLVTVVFNSIHYLSPQQRPAFWRSVAGSLKPGGIFLSQQNTHDAQRKYWLRHTHRWQAEMGYAFWSGLPGNQPDAINVEKLYFAKQPDGSWRLATAQHPYYFFEEQEMRDGLAQYGVEIIDRLDGTMLGRDLSNSLAIWIVAKKTKSQ